MRPATNDSRNLKNRGKYNFKGAILFSLVKMAPLRFTLSLSRTCFVIMCISYITITYILNGQRHFNITQLTKLARQVPPNHTKQQREFLNLIYYLYSELQNQICCAIIKIKRLHKTYLFCSNQLQLAVLDQKDLSSTYLQYLAVCFISMNVRL